MCWSRGDGREFVLVLTETRVIHLHRDAGARDSRHHTRGRGGATKTPVEILVQAPSSTRAPRPSAAAEVTTLARSTIAVVLLLLLVFGSMRLLLLGVMTLALAIAAASPWCTSLREVHTGAGVWIEPHRQRHRLLDSLLRRPVRIRALDPASAVPTGPAILLGLTTTLVCYLVLAAVPFPVLEQIAVFCMTGLVVGCGCVLCLYPVLARARGKLPKFGPVAGGAIDRLLRAWRWTRLELIVLAALAVVIGLGLARSGFRTTSRHSNRPRNS
jgi:hypothetical protein